MCMHQDTSVFTKFDASNTKITFLTFCINCFCVLVPSKPLTIWASCGKCIMLFIKRNWVNCVCVTSNNITFWIFFFVSMALETEIILMLSWWLGKIYSHDSATTFNTSDCKTLTRSETTYAACRMSKRTFKNMNGIKLSISNISQIPKMNPFLTMRCNQ